MKRLRLFVSISGAILMIVGCAAMSPHTPETGDKRIEGTNLHEVVNAHVRISYLDPDVDYKRYGKVLLKPLNFDKLEIIQPKTTMRHTKFELTDKDKAQLDSLFHKAMEDALQKKGDFEVVENPGHDVLTLWFEVLQIAPNAPKDDAYTRPMSSTIYTEGAGAIIIGAVVTDSTSGETIAIFADIKDSSYMVGQNNRVSNTADVSMMFSSWGTEFNSALKGLQQ